MIFREGDRKRYEDFALSHKQSNLWQSWSWGEFQKALGRGCTRFGLEKGSKIVASAQVIGHKLPFGLSYSYIPRGPLFSSEGDVSAIFSDIVSRAQKSGAVFVKVDGMDMSDVPSSYTVRPSSSVQPEHSLVIDLTKKEDEILQLMKQKGRYNIRLAEKKGVEVRVSSSKDAVKDFFALLEQTTKRDEFRGHGIEFYSKMLSSLKDSAQLIMAYFEDEPIAGGIFTFYGKQAVYYYGASADSYRNLMAPYLVQWEAIKEAKKRGCEEYDFLGIAPEGAVSHPWLGVTDFKKKFGGSSVSYSPAFDIVLRPFWYFLYRMRTK